LRLGDVVSLASIISAAQEGRTVGRLIDGAVFTGVARSIGTDGGAADFGSDVRDQFLRVTLSGGADCFWPIATLVEETGAGIFAPYYGGAK
jgi:hypothetical protein